jgi:hypothetical protein
LATKDGDLQITLTQVWNHPVLRKKIRRIKMLAKSSKSRFAAIAIMALGVSTFMGTSAALATDVTVSGSVGKCEEASTVTAEPVDFGTVKQGTTGTQSLTPTITQGKMDDCADRTSIVEATIGSFTGEAQTTFSVSSDKLVVLDIEPLSGTSFPMTATVPTGAAIDGTFGATVTLTLIG